MLQKLHVQLLNIFDNEADEYNRVTYGLNRFYMHKGGGMVVFRRRIADHLFDFLSKNSSFQCVMKHDALYVWKKSTETESRWHIV